MQTVTLDEIPDDGLALDCYASQQAWLRGVMKDALHERFLPDDDAHLSLNLMRAGGTVNVIGGLYVRMHAICDRCLKEFPINQHIPVHMLLAPAHAMGKAGEHDEDNTSDDIGFGVYEGRKINLEGIVSEQVVLAQPMKNLCQPECQGLCSKCGQDLNLGACACGQVAGSQNPASEG